MTQQIPLDDSQRAHDENADEIRDDGTHEIASDLAFKRLAIANVMFYGLPDAGDRNWILIDAGVMGTKGLIESAARERFGEGARPAAIIMTHGHFDHVGALKQLAQQWETPIYAHQMEVPFLNGSQAYPPADPSVGGGLMALMSRFYPNAPIDVREHLQVLPADGSIPGMNGWKWIHTPGHTAGHASLWRESDRALIVGDAFVTTAQESAYSVATQNAEMHGPPMYFTPDWADAKTSVQTLAALEPELVITGHGPAMRGAEMRAALHQLAGNFNQIAVPEHGKYVDGAAATQA